MYWVLLIISGLLASPLMFCSYYRTKTRPSYGERWNKYPWEVKGRAKFQVWVWILFLLGLIIPIVNIFMAIILWVFYFAQVQGESDTDGMDLTETRIIVRSKILNEVNKFLTREL